MQYIKKIILENFQSHKYSEITLDPYLNVIVGPSDQGKSAIIRALKWALFNEPAGDFFIREGENESSVTVIFSDGIKVRRYRSRSKNLYYLYGASGEEIIFEGFGTSVPQEVRDKISIRNVELDSNLSNSINISEQLEGPFLLSEKNSTKANSIGRIVGVHIVDDALKSTLKDLRNLGARKKKHEEILLGLEENLGEYDYLDELVDKLSILRDIKQDIYNKDIRLNKLSQLFKNLNETERRLSSTKEDLKDLENIHGLIEVEARLSKQIQKFRYINHKFITLNNIGSQIRNDNGILSSLQNFSKADGIAKSIAELHIKLNHLGRLNTRYRDTIGKIEENKEVLSQLKDIRYIDINLNLIEKNLKMLKELTNLKMQQGRINKSLSIGKVYMEQLSEVDRVSDLQDSLEAKINLLDRLMDYRNSYNDIGTNRARIKNDLKDIDLQVGDMIERYRSLLIKIEVCPICFNSIDRPKVDEIIDSYR
ncbi:MAG: AAA family ATPase [Tissierellia bacterium]|nr:AAA family ATPase [Tissierellia bacterium]